MFFNIASLKLNLIFLYRHPHTAVIKKIDSAKIKYKIYGYNFFHKANDHGEVIVNYVWSPENPITNIKAAFTDMKHFHGKFSSFLATFSAKYCDNAENSLPQ